MNIQYDVFISYSHEDREIAEGICGFLESNGLRCFIDYRDIPRTLQWANVIPLSLRFSEVMIVIFSDYYNKSIQADREIAIAYKSNVPILVLRTEDVEYSVAKSFYLDSVNYIDAFSNHGTVPDKLLNNILAIKKTGHNQPNERQAHSPKEQSEARNTDQEQRIISKLKLEQLSRIIRNK